MDLLVKMVEYSIKRCLCYFAVGPKVSAGIQRVSRQKESKSIGLGRYKKDIYDRSMSLVKEVMLPLGLLANEDFTEPYLEKLERKFAGLIFEVLAFLSLQT